MLRSQSQNTLIIVSNKIKSDIQKGEKKIKIQTNTGRLIYEDVEIFAEINRLMAVAEVKCRQCRGKVRLNTCDG